MSDMNFGEGFLGGVILCSLILTATFVAVRDQGRDECENKLPRTEKCVQVWVPVRATHQGDTK